MPAHKLFQRPVITMHMSHESAKAFNLGVPGDAMTFQTNFIATLDHVGTHVDAFRHVNPKGAPVDEMPLEMFMGKAVCFDLRHIPDLGDITVKDMEEAEKKAGVKVNGHIVLLCTGFHKRTYPTLDSVWKNPLLTVEATRWLYDRGSKMHGVEGPSTDKPTDNIFRAASAVPRPWCQPLGMAGESGGSAGQGRIPVLRCPPQVQGRFRFAGPGLRNRQRVRRQDSVRAIRAPGRDLCGGSHAG